MQTVLLGEPRAATTLAPLPNVTLTGFALAAPDTVSFTVRSEGVAGLVALESDLATAGGAPAGYFSANLFLQARLQAATGVPRCANVYMPVLQHRPLSRQCAVWALAACCQAHRRCLPPLCWCVTVHACPCLRYALSVHVNVTPWLAIRSAVLILPAAQAAVTQHASA